MKRFVVAIASLAFIAAACTAGGDTTSIAPSAVDTVSHEPVTLTITGEWTGRECEQWKDIFPRFEDAYPWATIEPQCNIGDNKAIAAINAGNPPDVVQSFGVDNVGLYCSTGAWQDLNPYITGPDGLDMSVFPSAVFTYTTFEDKQCALPFMTDTFGLYYNLDAFQEAGISEPPTTTEELQADAAKLTKFNDDGSIAVAGFVPWIGYYCCGSNTLSFAHMFDASWLDESGQPAFASDPGWAEMFHWQHDFIADVYGDGDFATGSDKLNTFVAGHGGEWAGRQDFITGRTAITIDGEWRNAFINDFVPNLNYDTAPLPTSPDNVDVYGSGLVGGTVLALPKGSPHPNEAWLLLKWLATDTETLVYMANNVNNVPTTVESLTSPDLTLPPQFQTFKDVFEDPNSAWRPTSVLGLQLADFIDAFAADWQVGDQTDLQGGLQTAQEQTNDALAQSEV